MFTHKLEFMDAFRSDYNQGADRWSCGLHLWRNIQAGAEERGDWVGNMVMGFAFYDLDGREPALSCFAVQASSVR
jgi:hypothetical protein